MPARPTASLLALVLGAVAAVALVSCGGGEDAQLLPGGAAGEITENLDTVRRLASEGECVGAEDAAEQVSAQVEALDGVDARLKRALQRGAVRLNEAVATCEEATTEALAPSGVPETEGTEPPEQEKKSEKEKKEKPEKEEPTTPSAPTTTPTETTPTTPPTTPAPPPSESGGTGAPGGIGPGSPASGEG